MARLCYQLFCTVTYLKIVILLVEKTSTVKFGGIKKKKKNDELHSIFLGFKEKRHPRFESQISMQLKIF